MINANLFSWQEHDYEMLNNAFETECRVLLVHGRDFESPYHVVSTFFSHLSERKCMLLGVSADYSRLSHPFLPYTHAIDRLSEKYAKNKPVLPSIVKDLSKSDTITTLVENIINERRSSILLSARENDLLERIAYSTDNQLPVFLFYGYPHFDANSQNLTTLLLSGCLEQEFQFLRNAKYVFLCDTEDDDAYNRVKNFEHIDLQLSTPNVNDIQEILNELAPDLQISPSEQEKMFFLSGGRLSVMEILLRHLISKGQTAICESSQEIVKATLEDRISQMGEFGGELESVLEMAASIGNTFTIPILKQAAQSFSCELVLERSDKEYLTKCDKCTGKFSYYEIWDFFNSCPDVNRKREIANSLERAIYYFDPYDYLTRANYMERAGRISEACELYFFAYNTFFQEGLALESALVDKISCMSAQCGLFDYWNSLLQIYTHMSNLDYGECVQILDSFDHPPTTKLLLLKEYLTGICLHRLGKNQEQQKGAIVAIQEAVKHAKDVEDGLWCDCQMILMSLLVNNGGDITTAKQITKELTYYYTKKGHAPFAQKGLHALERKWSALYSVERAVAKTENSVLYFRNERYPSQYIMALNNHAANLIVLGKYTDAMEYLSEAMSALQKFKYSRINQMYILSNFCLCAVLSGRTSPSYVYNKTLPIITQKAFGDWTIIFRLNCAIYLALTGDLTQAMQQLQELEALSKELDDDYYLFYVYANLSSVLYLLGYKTKAICMLREKCQRVPTLFKATEKAYLEKRTEYWIAVMETVTIKDPKVFDTYLLDKHPNQTQWRFIGRGFLYSDIQFWSEP